MTGVGRGVLAVLGIFVATSFAWGQTAENGHKSGAPAGDSASGKIFAGKGCAGCHGSEGQGGTGQIARPRIAPTRFSLPGFVQIVRKPAGTMPPFTKTQVSDEELARVYAFLQSAVAVKLELPATADGKNGRKLFNNYGCYECHGGEGQGSVSTGGSRIGPPQIPFSAFASYVRAPVNQMPPYTAKAVSDAELGDIYLFLQGIGKPKAAKDIPLLNP